MKYDPIEEEKSWYFKGKSGKGESRPLPLRHHFAHNHVRSRLYDTLVDLGCHRTSSILEVGCGSGEVARYTSKASENVVGIDVSDIAVKTFCNKGFQGILADAKTLPFHNKSFNYVIVSGLLHHLVGQGDLTEYLAEFTRVVSGGGM